MRGLTVLALTGAFALTAFGQPIEPPSSATLERLGLKTEWISAVPLNGTRDGIVTVQVADDRQVFVQTRGGLLVAFDAVTGERQWSYRYDVATPTPFQVAFNDHYVFAFNVIRMIGLQRNTGIHEFSQNLPLAPTAAPMADNDRIYVVMAGNRMAAFEMPAALRMPDPKLVKVSGKTSEFSGRVPPLTNPADIVAKRYPGSTRAVNLPPEQFDNRKIKLTAEPGGGFGLAQRSPSLAVSGTMIPPNKAFDAEGHYINSSPSLATVSSLRQPYHLIDPTSKNVQRTPSLAAIPPSLASVYESTNLRPKSLSLRMDWIYGSTVPLTFPPLLTRAQVWGFTNTPIAVALAIDAGRSQIESRLTSYPTSAPAQALDIGYVPQNDGYLTAINLNGGTTNTFLVLWKSNVGGFMNQPPVPTKTAIYQSGAHSGIARVDLATGDVTWRTENSSDRIVAINDEHLYARDKHGRLFVYDRNSPADPGTHRAYPLATADLSGFDVSTTNSKTDRIYLAADSGLFVCLRDAAPKYAVPSMTAPPTTLPPPDRTTPKPADPTVTEMPKTTEKPATETPKKTETPPMETPKKTDTPPAETPKKTETPPAETPKKTDPPAETPKKTDTPPAETPKKTDMI